jgi:hypothetical protein
MPNAKCRPRRSWRDVGAAGLPFTPQQFFELFAVFNRALWPAAVVWWLASLGLVIAAWRNQARYDRPLTYLLAALWAWNALVYHAWLFTSINPAAWLFAALFAAEAGLLARTAARGGVPAFSAEGTRRWAGALLTVYAFAYPLVTIASGHRYPATPTFAVPCPTVILTLGLFLTARDVPLRLEIVPVAWAFIGGSAALLLDVPADYALLGAGVLLTAVIIVRAGSARDRLPRAPRGSWSIRRTSGRRRDAPERPSR